jgi:hypothetical protein
MPTLHESERVQTYIVDPFVVAFSRRCTFVWGWWQTGHCGTTNGGRSLPFRCNMIALQSVQARVAVRASRGAEGRVEEELSPTCFDEAGGARP